MKRALFRYGTAVSQHRSALYSFDYHLKDYKCLGSRKGRHVTRPRNLLHYACPGFEPGWEKDLYKCRRGGRDGMMTPNYLAGIKRYKQERVLGSGAFGVVVQALDLHRGGALVAIKLLERGPALRNHRSYVQREIENQVQLQHPLIVEVHEVFLTPRYLAIAMEYAKGGDLYGYIIRNTSHGRLPENHAKALFQQLILGIDFCHRMGISSRDLKLENLLLDRDGRDGVQPLLKICDFGYSKNESTSPARSNVGTPTYMAPELIIGLPEYDGKKADIWSCAVILYAIIFGTYPFDERDECFVQKIIKCEYTLPKEPEISGACRDLIQRMLVANPEHRIRMSDIKRHSFFQEGLPDGALGMNDSLLRTRPFLDPQSWQQYKQRIQAIVYEATKLQLN